MTDTPATARHYAIDYARFIAIIGMVGVHLITPVFESFHWGSVPQYLVWIVGNGNASTLFAILGGCSVVFASRGLLAAGQPGRAMARIMVRGVLIALVGLGLGLLMPPMAVVLTPYGVAMCVVAAFIVVPSWIIAVITGALVLAGGYLNLALRAAVGSDAFPSGSPSFTELNDPWAVLTGVAVTGPYPIITWSTYMLGGILIGRVVLAGKSRRFWSTLAGAAGGIYLVLWVITFIRMSPLTGSDVMGVLSLFGMGVPISPELLDQVPIIAHSGSFGDMLGTGSFSLMVIALLMAIVRNGRQPLLLQPIRSAGAAPLTIYCFHVILAAVLTTLETQGTPVPGHGWTAWFIHVGAILVIGAVLAILHRRGPLETAVGWIVNKVVPARTKPADGSDDIGSGVPHLNESGLARAGSDTRDEIGEDAHVDAMGDRVKS